MRAAHSASLFAVVAALGSVPARSDAARPPAGASSCTGCHAAGAAMGALDGRTEAEIADALAAFRSGARPATIMNRIATGFDERESRAVAAWFAARGAR
ncbi:cytochrome C [Methylobacterium sp. NEAU 140]|uniref:c-type cytochrome n=1 Tax=Methylobacterium sp. NEAU 140 TaxID=3064945 RepID=UPI002737070F|nr:cytochrome C [Methylobacterium sp. NEAU 140]MDP4024962.1 cytochrome C [Methylobacterium sp. NEAU 140]